jgi:hypothetical protein
MALPHGALEQLLSPDGGVAAFDKAVADSQAQTQALLNREPAPGPTNQVKKDVKPGTAKDAATNEPPKDAPESEQTEPTTLDLADTSIEDLRAIAGTTRPALPKQHAEMWDEHLEGGFLQFAINCDMSSQTMQELMEFYAETSIVSAGQSREWAIEQFHRTFEGRVPREVRDLLVEFWKADILGDSAE